MLIRCRQRSRLDRAITIAASSLVLVLGFVRSAKSEIIYPGGSCVHGAVKAQDDQVGRRLRVGGSGKKPLKSAVVILRTRGGKNVRLRWNDRANAFIFPEIDPTDGRVTISCKGYRTRTIVLKGYCELAQDIIFVGLAKPGEDLYFYLCQAVPFTPRRDIIFVMRGLKDSSQIEECDRFIASCGLVEVDPDTLPPTDANELYLGGDHRSLRDQNIRLYRKSDGALFDRYHDDAIRKLVESDMMRMVGTPMKLSRYRMEGFEYTILVQPDPAVPAKTWMDAIASLGITRAPISYGYNVWTVYPNPGTGNGICELVTRLAESGLFLSAQNSGFALIGNTSR